MKLLFVTLYGHGHVNPTLPLVTELVRRGHDVLYATAYEHADTVRATGASVMELRAVPPIRPAGPDPLWCEHLFEAMSGSYPLLLDHCVHERPDVIVYDAMNWPARLIARRLGIPAVRTVPHFASNSAFTLMPPELAAPVALDCAEFSAAHGDQIDVTEVLDAPETSNLVFLPREFQPAGDTFDSSFHFVGPMLGRRAEEPWSPRCPGLPLVFMSPGTIMTGPEFYEACVTAFAGSEVQVALKADVPAPMPANFDVRPWFPQPAVLRHAQVFVTHGGMNSVMESLAAGVPMVVMPLMGEQDVNARRVEELGLGVRLRDVGDLRAVVSRVAESGEIRRNVERMRAALASSGGVGWAADLVCGAAMVPGTVMGVPR